MTEMDITHVSEMNRKIAESIALLEEATQKIEHHDLVTGQRLQASETYFNKRMEEIRASISELKEFTTQAGVARFRVMAERALQEGKEHLLAVQKATESFHAVMQEDVEYLHRTAENASNWIAESLKSLKLDDFRRLMVESIDQIDEVSSNAVKRITKMVKWFHWQKLGVAVTVAVVASLLTALFVNDEMPWESHKQVVAEREAGKILYQAWPALTPEEKSHIQEGGARYL